MAKNTYCVVRYILQGKLSSGQTEIVDEFAKLTGLSMESIGIQSCYNIPTSKIKSMTVSFIDGRSTHVILNSGEAELASDGHGSYSFAIPRFTYGSEEFFPVTVSRYVRIHAAQAS